MKGGGALIFTDEDLKAFENLEKDLATLKFTEDDLRRFADLERQFSEMDLDFLLR